jgi:hypothetical protein
MNFLIKILLSLSFFCGFIVWVGPAEARSVIQAAPLRVSLPRRSEGNAEDHILIRYTPTKRSLVMGTQGVLILNSRVLSSLGWSGNESLQAGDFEFYRVYRSQGVSKLSIEERSQLVSWVSGGNFVAGQRLQLESLSTVRSERSGNTLNLSLRPTYLLLGAMPVPQVEVKKKRIDPELERRRRRTAALAQLDSAWQRLSDGKYDQSLVGFDALLRGSRDLFSEEELDKVVFGRGLSRFHQVGCREAAEDFDQLQKLGPFYPDALYYGSLCSLDRGETSQARERMSALLALNNERYAEQGRFYLGVIAEAEADFVRAESAYLDTVDFSENTDLVRLAKERLNLLEDRKARDRYAKKIFSIMASLGLGWDSNALSLSTSQQPSDLNLKTGSSPSYLGLLYLEAKNPLLFPLQQKFQYTFLGLGYSDAAISQTTDLQSHELGVNVEWGEEIQGKHKLTASYGMTFLGQMGSSSKFMTTSTLKWDWTKAGLGKQSNIEHLWLHSLRVQKLSPTAEPTSAATDSNAIALSGSHRYKIFRDLDSWGPGVDWEYKAAKGNESKLALLGLSASYDKPFEWGGLKLNFGQELGIKNAFYFKSELSRKDFLVSSTSSLSHMLGQSYELRGQFVLMKNFSNLSQVYGFNRFQLNMSMTAFF